MKEGNPISRQDKKKIEEHVKPVMDRIRRGKNGNDPDLFMGLFSVGLMDFTYGSLAASDVLVHPNVIERLLTIHDVSGGLNFLAVVGMGYASLGMTRHFKHKYLDQTPWMPHTKRMLRKELTKGIADSYPEKPINEALKDILLLPPVGAKIVSNSKNRVLRQLDNLIPPRQRVLPPHFTADGAAAHVEKYRKKVASRSEYAIQYTVQGKLPDEFKYTALAFILSNPYQQEWNDQFYGAPWGKVGPLIHDGGRENSSINPYWAGVSGRTDYIQRLYKWNVKDGKDLSFGQAQENVYERQEVSRIQTELKAYQRLAFACWLKYNIYRMPNLTPLKESALINEWNEFCANMRDVLREAKCSDALSVQWFEQRPRIFYGWPGARYESDAQPILKSLEGIENARQKNPAVIQEAYNLLVSKTHAIDTILVS